MLKNSREPGITCTAALLTLIERLIWLENGNRTPPPLRFGHVTGWVNVFRDEQYLHSAHHFPPVPLKLSLLVVTDFASILENFQNYFSTFQYIILHFFPFSSAAVIQRGLIWSSAQVAFYLGRLHMMYGFSSRWAPALRKSTSIKLTTLSFTVQADDGGAQTELK